MGDGMPYQLEKGALLRRLAATTAGPDHRLSRVYVLLGLADVAAVGRSAITGGNACVPWAERNGPPPFGPCAGLT